MFTLKGYVLPLQGLIFEENLNTYQECLEYVTEKTDVFLENNYRIVLYDTKNNNRINLVLESDIGTLAIIMCIKTSVLVMSNTLLSEY